MAAKWLHDILRTHGRHWPRRPRFVYHFDSTSAAGSALGWYIANGSLVQKARALHQLLQHGHQVMIEPVHTHGHQGNPGNEAADSLANYAAAHAFAADDFWNGRCAEEVVTTELMQWFWVLVRPELRGHWLSGFLQLPNIKLEEDSQVIEALDSWQEKEVQAPSCMIKFRAVTCNVLSLKDKFLSAYLATMSFLDQGHKKKISLIALQETRLKRLRFTHPEYIVVTHPAVSGKGGVLLALHRRFFRLKGPDGEGVTERYWTVVHSSSELLITRLWCGALDVLIVNAHAPHSGRPCEDIESFWRFFRRLIPDYLRAKQMVLLVDANARVGSVVSEAEETPWQGEEETQSGSCFHDHL